MKQTKKHILRTLTNGGDLAKQYYWAVEDEPMELALLISKYVLADKLNPYYNKYFERVKVFRDKALFFQPFGIKVSSLEIMLNTLTNK
jgi:hypothetical protein